jgi:polysaccharide export outer membrane protein
MYRIILAICILFAGTFHGYSQAMLRPGDIVEIRLGGVPAEYIQEFSSQYTVDDLGAINLPYVGPVTVSNLSLSEATRAIENKLKTDQIYTNPSITINVTPQTRFVNVGGAVRQPGRIPYTPDLTLMSAINAAGGFNEFASPKSIRLIRGGKSEVYDGRKLRKDPSLDPKIGPGDQIEVPQSWL